MAAAKKRAEKLAAKGQAAIMFNCAEDHLRAT